MQTKTTHNADAVARWLAKGNQINRIDAATLRENAEKTPPYVQRVLAMHDGNMERQYNF